MLPLHRRDAEGVPIVARVVWDSLEFTAPDDIEAGLDGRLLPPVHGARIELPRLPGRGAHPLSVLVRFPRQITARSDALFGSGLGEEAVSELTAVALELEGGAQPRAVRRSDLA